MGWDAISSVKVKRDEQAKRMVIASPEVRTTFEQASLEVQKEASCVDCLLDVGGLDVSYCGYLLEKATGKDVYDKKGWSSRFVKQLNKEANWNFKVSKEDLWAYLSAKNFLELCAKFNLAIRFSW